MNPIRLRQLQDRAEELEEEIARLEAAIAATEQELAVFKSAEESQRLMALADEQRAGLAARMGEWEDVSSVLAEMA